MEKYTNSLVHENSPYLLQHAHNPVDWLPWGKEALERAMHENKLIFVSIGYAACHWCHVMERELFEDVSLAELLNRNFICIKVDREERPDIDQVFMSAVQLMTGSGGWPLNCFATPEAKPFFGGTYYPPAQLTDIVQQLTDIWKNEPQKIYESADSLQNSIAGSELVKEKNEYEHEMAPGDIYNKLASEFDCEDGGLKRVPKFPMPGIYSFLLKFFHYSGREEALNHVILTVNKIIRGGIYDQLGGGIARYSTDKFWFVPHFEKMLYDNARFISLLSSLYAITKEPGFKKILYDSADFLERDLARKEGGYYASLDADSVGEEGLYYTWNKADIDVIAGDHGNLIKAYWGITTKGNWESGKNILAVSKEPDELAKTFGLPVDRVVKIIDETVKKLRDFRELRNKPATDTKILTSWNALVVKGFVDAWQATGDRDFLETALRTGNFILENLIEDDFMVKRSLASHIPGFLDDYALTADAFLSLYQAVFDESWLSTVQHLLEKMISEFFNTETGMFYYVSERETDTLIRQTEVTDNVLPSSNAVLASVLFRASRYLDDIEYEKMARQMLQNVMPYLVKHPAFFPEWAGILLLTKQDPIEIVITGPQYKENRERFTRMYLPEIIFAGAWDKSTYPLLRDRFVKDHNRIYVCRSGACNLPVETVTEALKQF